MLMELEAWYKLCCKSDEYLLSRTGYKASVDAYYNECKSSQDGVPTVDDPAKAYLRLPIK